MQDFPKGKNPNMRVKVWGPEHAVHAARLMGKKIAKARIFKRKIAINAWCLACTKRGLSEYNEAIKSGKITQAEHQQLVLKTMDAFRDAIKTFGVVKDFKAVGDVLVVQLIRPDMENLTLPDPRQMISVGKPKLESVPN